MTDQGHARYDILDTSGTLAKTFRRESRVRLVGAAGRAASFAPSGSLYEQVLIPPPDMDEGLARYDTATGRFMDTLRLTKRPVVVREKVSVELAGRVRVLLTSQVAKHFGGGGHHNSAGCAIGNSEKEKHKLLDELASLVS